MRFRTALPLACLLAALVLVTVPLEAAKNHKNFVLYNQSGSAIDGFYFSPSGWEDWGENQLSNGPLEQGEWIWNRHNYRERYYDIRVEFENGYAFEVEEIDLTEVLRIYVRCDGTQCWVDYAYE